MASEQIKFTNAKEDTRDDKHHEFTLVIEGVEIARARFRYDAKPIPHYYVSNVFVTGPENQGYASKLMEAVEEKLRESGKAGILIDAIDTRSKAYEMYKRRGWVRLPADVPQEFYAYNLPEGTDIPSLAESVLRYMEKRSERQAEKMLKKMGVHTK